jgi:hypothetical protein
MGEEGCVLLPNAYIDDILFKAPDDGVHWIYFAYTNYNKTLIKVGCSECPIHRVYQGRLFNSNLRLWAMFPGSTRIDSTLKGHLYTFSVEREIFQAQPILPYLTKLTMARKGLFY